MILFLHREHCLSRRWSLRFRLPTVWHFRLGHPHESWTPLTFQVSGSFYGCPCPASPGAAHFNSFSSHLMASHPSPLITDHAPPFTFPPLSQTGSLLPLPPMILLFHLLSGIEASSHGSFFLLNFLRSMDCTMGILSFLDNIHLSVNT